MSPMRQGFGTLKIERFRSGTFAEVPLGGIFRDTVIGRKVVYVRLDRHLFLRQYGLVNVIAVTESGLFFDGDNGFRWIYDDKQVELITHYNGRITIPTELLEVRREQH